MRLIDADALIAEIVKTTTFVKDSVLFQKMVDEAPTVSADRPQGEWKEVYAETDYRNGWIEFSCECCEHQHGLESGEYGWSYGEPIPWKFCPLCGAKMTKGGESDE